MEAAVNIFAGPTYCGNTTTITLKSGKGILAVVALYRIRLTSLRPQAGGTLPLCAKDTRAAEQEEEEAQREKGEEGTRPPHAGRWGLRMHNP